MNSSSSSSGSKLVASSSLKKLRVIVYAHILFYFLDFGILKTKVRETDENERRVEDFLEDICGANFTFTDYY